MDPETGTISDTKVSDNGDRDIVLATVATTIFDFIELHGDHFIYATGSTGIRTRLYQISIAKLLNEITEYLHVYGSADGEWHEFRRNVNYDAFLVKHK